MTQIVLDDAFPFDGDARAKRIASPSRDVAHVPDQPWLEITIETKGTSWTARLATEDPHGEELLTAIRTTPNPDVVCAVASGTAYAVRASDSTGDSWIRLEPHSVRYSFPDTRRLQLILIGDTHVAAYKAPTAQDRLLELSWKTDRIRHGDLRLLEGSENGFRVAAWDGAIRDHRRFDIDLVTGSVEAVP